LIGIIFNFGTDVVEVRVNGNNCLFRTKQFGGAFAPIEGLNIDKKGSLKEFPDLKDREDWKEETIKRFKEKLKNMRTEEERIEYIKNDLQKYGYVPIYKQKQGFRPEKIR
jgi:hypothetical protein